MESESSQSLGHPSSSQSNPFLVDETGNEPDAELDNDKEDDEIPQCLTESYSEITLLRKFCENPTEIDDEENDGAAGGAPQRQTRPDSLIVDEWMKQMDGTFAREGNLTHFVAENLEQKIRLSSPGGRYGSKLTTPSGTGHQLPRNFMSHPSHLTQVDSNVLNDIEIEASYLAASVDNLTENLQSLLHSISSITADNVDCYKNAVNKLTDCMDANIKHMYTIMAKTEEISNAMKPVEELATKVRDLKKLVDLFESNL
ncbi:BLOC-1-related complex subunit 6 [Culicoides brevitarsis]|uniref:BLOC-1-related complex subunit 6 n=1 Tax=Culicoides brevitarsis TaxID=469753 RepID=UPI00307B8945